MNIVVAIKRVPDTTTKIKVGPDGRSIHPEGVSYIISPYDEYAIEMALKFKEAAGTGEITGISMDPDGQETILRKALAMGLDRGVLLKGGPWMDGYAVARALATELKSMKFDLLLFGKQAVDDDSCQVPALVAHQLGLPLVSVVNQAEAAGGKIRAHRPIEGAEEIYELAAPCALAITKGAQEPRYPTLKGIMAAKKKPIDVKNAQPGEATMEIVRLEPPADRPPGRVVGQGVDAVPELIRLLRQEAKVL